MFLHLYFVADYKMQISRLNKIYNESPDNKRENLDPSGIPLRVHQSIEERRYKTLLERCLNSSNISNNKITFLLITQSFILKKCLTGNQ
jgi:hypothetical protein